MARFFNSIQQPFISQFVPEDLNLQRNYFDDLQKNQDSYRTNISGLNVKSDAMENDIPGAIEARKRIDRQLLDLRNIDYNDPNQKKQALQVIPNVQNAISAFGEIGARTKKKQEFDNIQKELDSRYKDLPMMKSYMTSKLRETNLDPSRAIYFENGAPKNTEIVLPKEFNYTDLNENISKLLKDTEFDQISVNSGLSPEKGHEALYSYMSGNVQEKTGEKIYNALKNRILSNGNQVESIKADASYYGGNPSDRLEQALQGAVIGGKFRRSNLDKKYIEDSVKASSAKQTLEPDNISGTMASGDVTKEGVTIAGKPILDFFTKDNKGDSQVDWTNLTSSLLKSPGLNNLIIGGPTIMGTAPGVTGITTMGKDGKKITDDQVQQKIFNIAKANGLDKDSNGNTLRGTQVVENTLRFLQNINISANSDYIPPLEVAQSIEAKVDQGQLNHKLMVDISGKTYEDAIKDSGDKTKPKFMGIDYSDKEKPRFKYLVTTDKGEEYRSYSIPNDSYNSVLKPINNVLSNTYDKLKEVSDRKPSEIKQGSDLLIKYANENSDAKKSLGIYNLSDLVPIGGEEYNGKIIYTYMDKTNPGKMVGLVAVHNPKTKNIEVEDYIPSLSNFAQVETDELFSHPETKELRPKLHKRENFIKN